MSNFINLFKMPRFPSFVLLSALILSVNNLAFAASGDLIADPELVIIPAGQSTGTSNLSWTSVGTQLVYITVACGQGNESVVGYSLPTGSITVPWITATQACTFRLRAETANGQTLDVVTVTGYQPAATGSLSANPSTVVIPAGQTHGTTQLSWTAINTDIAFLTVDCGTGTESPVGQVFPVGTLSVNWITPDSACLFRLRTAALAGQVLDEVNVVGLAAGVPSGSIGATPDRVLIPHNQTHGSTQLSWNATNTEFIYLTVACGAAAESELGFAFPAGTMTIPWISAGITCKFRLRAETLTGTVLDEVDVTGVAQTAPTGSISASPEVVHLEAGNGSGSTVLSWTLAGSSAGIVTKACDGGTEVTLLSVGPSGVLSFSPIGANMICIFRLRNQSSTGIVLASVTVRGVVSQPASDFATLLFGPGPQSGQGSTGRTEDICQNGQRTGQKRQITRFENGQITLDNVTSNLRFRSTFDLGGGYLRNVSDATVESSVPTYPQGATYTLLPPLPYARLNIDNSNDSFSNWGFQHCTPGTTGSKGNTSNPVCASGVILSYGISLQIQETANYTLLTHTEDYRDVSSQLHTVSEFDLDQGRFLGYWRTENGSTSPTWYHVCPEADACSCYNPHPN